MTAENEAVRPDASPKVIRLIRPSVVVLCGPAACGKSTFAAQHFRPTQIVSSDHMRALVCDDESDQRFQTQAFALLHFLIEQRLSINRLCVVDSTALTAQARRSLLEIARRHQVPAVVLRFDVPLAACLERDGQRPRTVGQATIERQHQLFEQAKATLQQEGFDQVIELSDGDLGKVRFEIVFRPLPRPAGNSSRQESRRPVPRGTRPAEPRPAGPAAMSARTTPEPAPAAAPAAAPNPSGQTTS